MTKKEILKLIDDKYGGDRDAFYRDYPDIESFKNDVKLTSGRLPVFQEGGDIVQAYEDRVAAEQAYKKELARTEDVRNKAYDYAKWLSTVKDPSSELVGIKPTEGGSNFCNAYSNSIYCKAGATTTEDINFPGYWGPGKDRTIPAGSPHPQIAGNLAEQSMLDEEGFVPISLDQVQKGDRLKKEMYLDTVPWQRDTKKTGRPSWKPGHAGIFGGYDKQGNAIALDSSGSPYNFSERQWGHRGIPYPWTDVGNPVFDESTPTELRTRAYRYVGNSPKLKKEYEAAQKAYEKAERNPVAMNSKDLKAIEVYENKSNDMPTNKNYVLDNPTPTPNSSAMNMDNLLGAAYNTIQRLKRDKNNELATMQQGGIVNANQNSYNPYGTGQYGYTYNQAAEWDPNNMQQTIGVGGKSYQGFAPQTMAWDQYYQNGGSLNSYQNGGNLLEVWDEATNSKYKYYRNGKNISGVQQKVKGEDGKKYWIDVDPKSDIYKSFKKDTKQEYKANKLLNKYENKIYQGNKQYTPSPEFLEQIAYQQSLKEGDDEYYKAKDTDDLEKIALKDMGINYPLTTRKEFRRASRYNNDPINYAGQALHPNAERFKENGGATHPQAQYLAEKDEIIYHPQDKPVALENGGRSENSNEFSKITGDRHSDPSGGSQWAGGKEGFILSDNINVPKEIVATLQKLT